MVAASEADDDTTLTSDTVKGEHFDQREIICTVGSIFLATLCGPGRFVGL